MEQDRIDSWLERNIARQIINHGDIWLYTWIGTCSLTTINKQKYIALTTEKDDTIIDEITKKYEEIIRIINKYPGSKITILEVHVYSIKHWNKKKEHSDSDSFDEQDKILQRQIYLLNDKIRVINKRIGSHSPEFSSDISNNTKYHCGKDRKLKSTKTFDFGLYNDGIHPGNLLAKSWLKKISKQSKRDCWEEVHAPPTN